MVNPELITLLTLIAIIFAVWLLGFIIKLYTKRLKIAPETVNGINLLILLFQIVMILVIASIIYEVDSSAILGMSALFGTAIGFAIAVVVSNIVAGLYLITVRPFGIGDLIKLKETEGIVLEIGLNYTRLLQLDQTIVSIPNKNLLDTNLINCSIQVNDIADRAKQGFEIGFQSLMDELSAMQEKLGIRDVFADEILGGKEIARYPFTLQLKLNVINPAISIGTVNTRIKGLFDKWEDKLSYRPHFFYNKHIFRQDTTIIMIADQPQQILDVYPEFIEDFYITIFEELQMEVKNN
ncbi:MAG: mechanosensitive ion channel family protein [Candidatus Heimdallarchaeota archaeon]|nr:mechanosensitive ion channel family protein [Candidatus Heimdallarchaeota archaeon]